MNYNNKIGLCLLCIFECIQGFTPTMSLWIDRRSVINYAGATGAYLVSGNSLLENKGHITVIGASGETGKECVKLLVEEGKNVRAVSRKTFEFNEEDIGLNTKNLVESIPMDIKDRRSERMLYDTLKGSSAVIFLANAKKKFRYIKSDIEEFQNLNYCM